MQGPFFGWGQTAKRPEVAMNMPACGAATPVYVAWLVPQAVHLV
jgi:hypothetical protein